MVISSVKFQSKGCTHFLRHSGNRVIVDHVPCGNIFIRLDPLRRDLSVNKDLDFEFDASYRIRDLRQK